MSTEITTAAPATAPLADVTPHDGLCDEQGPIPMFPPRQFDELGRLIPVTPEERQARSNAARRALKAIAALPDTDPPGIDEQIMRDIDAERPHRPLFKGMY